MAGDGGTGKTFISKVAGTEVLKVSTVGNDPLASSFEACYARLLRRRCTKRIVCLFFGSSTYCVADSDYYVVSR